MEKLTIQWSDVPNGADSSSILIQRGLLVKMRSSVLELPM